MALDRKTALNLDFIRKHDHTRLYVFPNLQDRVMVKTRNRTKENFDMAKLNKARSSAKTKENKLLEFILNTSPKFLLDNIESKFVPEDLNETLIGPSYLIMTKEITMRHHELEFAVDFKDTLDALSDVEEISRKFTKNYKHDEEFFPHLPIAVRSVKGVDSSMLSPTLGRDSSYIEVLAHHNDRFGNYRLFFNEVENLLVNKYKARAHWGKRFHKVPAHQYPELEDFKCIQRKLDPSGKFLNKFLRKNLNIK